MEIDTLVTTHVIFRHGERTPDLTYPKDPYKDLQFPPAGRGNLTMEGKKSAFKLGEALRAKYGRFLGLYCPDLIDAWSTDSTRTQMTLQLVLASLMPPSDEQKVEASLNWQPIPYRYRSWNDDDMLLPFIRSDTQAAYNKLISTKAEVNKRKGEEVFSYLTEHSGMSTTTTRDALVLYSILKIQEDIGLPLPEWSKLVWPKALQELAFQEFRNLTSTTDLRRLVLGKLLMKIIDDTKQHIKGKSKCKMHIYSAHDVNLGPLLAYFNILHEIYPPYCCYLVFEVHKIAGEFGIKMFYEDYSAIEPKPIEFGCGTFIQFDQFLLLCNDVYNK